MDHNHKLILGYWNIRGLAERVRQLLQYCQLPYQEIKYSGSEDRQKWNHQIKPKLILKNPAITLPYLIDGEKVVSQSDAICVYVCFKGNKPELTGRDVDQRVALATAWGVFKDIHIQFAGLCYGMHGYPTFQEALAVYPHRFRPYLAKFNGLLGNNQFIAGGITWVDFGIADFLQALSLLFPDLSNEFPLLQSYQKRVWGLPELKDYFASDRFHERPINNYTAVWK